MRNIIVHQYAAVDLTIIWRVVTESLPALLAQLDPVIAEAEDQVPDGDDSR